MIVLVSNFFGLCGLILFIISIACLFVKRFRLAIIGMLVADAYFAIYVAYPKHVLSFFINHNALSLIELLVQNQYYMAFVISIMTFVILLIIGIIINKINNLLFFKKAPIANNTQPTELANPHIFDNVKKTKD